MAQNRVQLGSEKWRRFNKGPLLGVWAAKGTSRESWWGNGSQQEAAPCHPLPGAERMGRVGSGSRARGGNVAAAAAWGLTHSSEGSGGYIPPHLSPPCFDLLSASPVGWICSEAETEEAGAGARGPPPGSETNPGWNRQRVAGTRPPSICESRGLEVVILPHVTKEKVGFQKLVRLTSSIGTNQYQEPLGRPHLLWNSTENHHQAWANPTWGPSTKYSSRLLRSWGTEWQRNCSRLKETKTHETKCPAILHGPGSELLFLLLERTLVRLLTKFE